MYRCSYLTDSESCVFCWFISCSSSSLSFAFCSLFLTSSCREARARSSCCSRLDTYGQTQRSLFAIHSTYSLWPHLLWLKTKKKHLLESKSLQAIWSLILLPSSDLHVQRGPTLLPLYGSAHWMETTVLCLLWRTESTTKMCWTINEITSPNCRSPRAMRQIYHKFVICAGCISTFAYRHVGVQPHLSLSSALHALLFINLC